MGSDGVSKSKISTFLVLSLLPLCVLSQEWPTQNRDFTRTGYTASAAGMRAQDIEILWNYSAGAPVRGSPIMADIDSDGFQEVIFGSDDGNLYVLDYTGKLKWKYQTEGNVRSTPTAFDLGYDSGLEIIFGSDDKRLYVLNSSGHKLFSYEAGGFVRGSAAVADLGGIPGYKIVFGSYDGRIHCLNAAGDKLWDYKTLDSVTGSPALYDIDSDQNPEALLGSGGNTLYALKHPPYKTWAFTASGDMGTPSIASGIIFAGSHDNKLYRLRMQNVGSAEERRVWRDNKWVTETVGMTGLANTANYTANGRITGSPSVGPINSSLTAVVFGTSGRTLYILDSKDLKPIRAYTVNRPIESSPAIARLTGGSAPEIIFADTGGTIHVIGVDGRSAYKHQTGHPVRTSPAVADINFDGTLEFAFGADDGILYMFGDIKSWTVEEATIIYRSALTKKMTGHPQEARRLADESLKTYSGVGYQPGVQAAETLIKRIDADTLYSKAESLYENASLIPASRTLAEAAQLYYESDDLEGLAQSDILFRRIEAKTYYEEAKHFYSIGEGGNASVYLEAAIYYYRMLNDRQGLEEADRLSKIYMHQGKSTTYYDDGLKALTEGRPDDALLLLGFASQAAELIGDEPGLEKAKKALNRVRGDISYESALEAKEKGDFRQAFGHAEKAMEYYSQSGRPGNIQNASGLMNQTGVLLEADIAYDEAQRLLSNMELDEAAQYARKAQTLYDEGEDARGSEKSLQLYNQITGAGQGGLPDIGVKPTTLAVLLLLAASTIILAYNPPKDGHSRLWRVRRGIMDAASKAHQRLIGLSEKKKPETKEPGESIIDKLEFKRKKIEKPDLPPEGLRKKADLTLEED
jgi:hypothetical protein